MIKRHPSVVVKFESFDGSTPFKPINLCGVITYPSDYDKEKHGTLRAVVEYHTT